MDDFVVQFKRQRALMSKYGVNLLSTDKDALYAFHKKLHVAYKDKQLHVMANEMNFLRAISYYKNVAKCFSDLPGSTHSTAPRGKFSPF